MFIHVLFLVDRCKQRKKSTATAFAIIEELSANEFN